MDLQHSKTRSTEGSVRGPQYGPFTPIKPEKRSLGAACTFNGMLRYLLFGEVSGGGFDWCRRPTTPGGSCMTVASPGGRTTNQARHVPYRHSDTLRPLVEERKTRLGIAPLNDYKQFV